MTTLPPALDFTKLRALTLHEQPFRHVVHDPSILHPTTLETLCEPFPVTSNVGHNDVHNVTLSEAWKTFIDEIHSQAYREAMETVTGLDLTPYSVGIGIRQRSKHSHGAPHADVPRKKVTHLMYFNHAWPYAAGRLRILRSNHLEDVHEVITPLKGYGLVFVVSHNSFHRFEPFEGVRQAIQINFEHPPSLFSIFFSTYE